MNIESWIGIVVGMATIITTGSLGVRWLTKHYFVEIKHELQPNGGSSMKDQVNRLERDIQDLKNQNIKGEEFHEKLDSKLDHLTEVFINYVSNQK